LFNAGSEARRLEEVIQFQDEFNIAQVIKRRYDKIYLVASKETIDEKYFQNKDRFKRLGAYEILPVRRSELSKVLPGYLK